MCRYGRSPWALLNNLKPRTTTTTPHDGGITSQSTWEYPFIHNSLYQRTRVSMILPRSDDNYTPTVQPCPHHASYHAALGRRAIEVQEQVRQSPKLRACSDIVSCRHCRTVLRVGCRKFRGLGMGLFVTWWLDLGGAGQPYFDFEGMDSLKDRRELLATARGVLKG
ncbi:hypothetical protein VE02_07423 [Pseudogymnoascus sp. 03VT05]|nr:hypothetical protein VE02_07423 [Pseudogymnoascus sp. 03VT05]